jgi:hypothetical protein
LRKGEGIEAKLIPRAEFDFTPARREFFKSYADLRFGEDVMTFERLDALFAAKVVSHLLVFTDTGTKAEVGAVAMYVEPKRMAYYYYAFFDAGQRDRNLGMYMMTTAIGFFAAQGFEHVYLGTCYLRNALYKTQFAGVEFFNGCGWSGDLAQLKYLIEREQGDVSRHLLETEEYLKTFCGGDLARLAAETPFRIPSPPGWGRGLG